jgi:hypothetical protein
VSPTSPDRTRRHGETNGLLGHRIARIKNLLRRNVIVKELRFREHHELLDAREGHIVIDELAGMPVTEYIVRAEERGDIADLSHRTTP